MSKNLTYEEIKKAADEYEADDMIVKTAFTAGAYWAKGYLQASIDRLPKGGEK